MKIRELNKFLKDIDIHHKMSENSLKMYLDEEGLTHHKHTMIKRYTNGIHSKEMRKQSSVVKALVHEHDGFLLDFDETG